MAYKNRTDLLYRYFLISYFAVLILCLYYVDFNSLTDLWTFFFFLSTLISYSAAYLLPAFFLTMAANILSNLWNKRDKLSLAGTPTVLLLAVTTTSLTLTGLYVDQQIYQLFGFHVNGFVINLITSPGGIASMGGSDNATMVYGLIVVSFIAMQFIFLLLCRHMHTRLILK